MSEAYQYIVNRSRDFITLIDQSYRYTLVNDAYCEAIGKDRHELINRTVEEVWGTERFEGSIRARLDECFAGSEVHYIEDFRFGSMQKRLHVSFYPYADEIDGTIHALVFSHDISKLAETESRLAQFEYRDRTTGLYNRRSLEEMLEAEVDRAARRTDGSLAVLFVSLHSFKAINQTHGHHIGDLLLEHTGNRIREAIRASDLLFRFDGTNLVVILTRISQPTDAAIVAQKIADDVAVPYQYRGRVITINTHTGIALFPADGNESDSLIQAANSTSVDAEERQMPFLFYDTSLHDLAVDRMTRLSDLHAAIAGGMMELSYHPIVRLDGDEPTVVGAEALIRMRHETRGLLQPNDFLDLAEDSRLITAIDKWAFFQTVRLLAELLKEFDLFLTMNLSAQELGDEDLPEIVENALSQFPEIEPHRLKLELTERGSMADPEASLARMERLRELGSHIWIDDFGTGQSSLSYLKELPASTLKIDRSLVHGIDESENDRRYLAGIVETIKARGKSIVAEGVETSGQLEIVRDLGCSYAQGFYFGPPLTPDEFRELLSHGREGIVLPCPTRSL